MKKHFLFFFAGCLLSGIVSFFILARFRNNLIRSAFFASRRENMMYHNLTREFSLPANNPPVVKGSNAKHMHPDDLVLGINYRGIVRAYPRWFLVSYHIVNDTIAQQPILVTQCEVCSGGSAFYPKLSKDTFESLSFQVCPNVMGTFSICDTQTNSFWHPFSGVSFSGKLKGAALERIPTSFVKWKNWLKNNPDTDVILSSEEQKSREHGHGERSNIGADWLPQNMRETANLNDLRLPWSQLIFGVDQRGLGPQQLAIDLSGLNEFSSKRFRFNQRNYLIVRAA